MLNKPCPDRVALERRYLDSVRLSTESLRELSSLAIGIAHSDWELAWKLSQRASDACQRAHALLKRHVAEHHCGIIA